MASYILRRLFAMLFVLLTISLFTFSFMHLIPGDPARIIAERRYGDEVSLETIEGIRRDLALDRSFLFQYLSWFFRILQGDLGISFRTGRPVSLELRTRFLATLELALAAIFVSLILAIPLGVFSAMKQYSFFDSLAMFGAMLGVSMPNFWLALLFIMFFSLNLGLLPVFGRGTPLHLILPAMTLGTGIGALTTRLTRSSILDILKEDYVRGARAKGLSEKIVMGKHVLKNAFIPVVTIIGLQFGSLLEGAVVVEVIFAWPGLGRLLYDSIFARDFPVIQGSVLLMAIMYVLVNLLVDLSYAWLDPKIRYGID